MTSRRRPLPAWKLRQIERELRARERAVPLPGQLDGRDALHDLRRRLAELRARATRPAGEIPF